MSLNLAKNKAHITVWVRGWNDEVIDSGEGDTEDGLALEDFSTDLDYDFGADFDWDSLAQDLDINLDLDGNIDLSQQESLSEDLADLADNEEAIYNYMTDHGDSTGIPARIRVTNPPDKLEYSDGDEIDFTGIIVCAYSSLTTRTPFIRQEWGGPRHNQIPFSELTFPVTTAEMPENEASKVISGHSTVQDMMPFKMYDHVYFKKTSSSSPIYTKAYIFDGGMIACFLNDEIHVVLIVYASKTASRNWYSNSYRDKTIDYDDLGTLSMTYTYNGQTVYYSYRETGLNSEKSEILAGGYNFSDRITDNHSADFELAKYIAWSMMYGEIESPEISIPVQWQTEYREEPYEASFDIVRK